MQMRKLVEAVELVFICATFLFHPIRSTFYHIPADVSSTMHLEHDGLSEMSYTQCVLRCRVKCKKAAVLTDKPNQCLCLNLDDTTVSGEDNLLGEIFVSFNFLLP